MRIFIDIGHPAHVHYFRNFIKIMKMNTHEFFISSRQKEVSQALLEKYNIAYLDRGKGSSTFLGKLFYMFKANWLLLKMAISFNPDLFLSFASPYAAHISKLLKKPHISFTDTEHAKFGILSFAPFTECIITPSSFRTDFGKKQVRFNGFMELSYLHPAYYTPDINTVKSLGIKENEKYIFLRFVSWDASHDMGHYGLSDKEKINVVKELSLSYKVLISSEGIIPAEIEKYKVLVSPEKIHDILFYATLYIGEGATMASECAMLGTPAIYVNPLSAGTLEEQEQYGLLHNYKTSQGIMNKARELLSDLELKTGYQAKRQKMLSEKINVTAFMVWFIENYPDSFKIMLKDPDYQNRFN